MKKRLLSVMFAVIAAFALGTVRNAHAQSITPQRTSTGVASVYGNGGRGNRGGMGAGYASGTQDGLLHDEMMTIYSQALGISIEELNDRLTNGETLTSIALSQGLTVEQIQTLRVNTRTQVLAQAVSNGTLTQEQANLMNAYGYASGNSSGLRGNGLGLYGNADCPCLQTTP